MIAQLRPLKNSSISFPFLGRLSGIQEGGALDLLNLIASMVTDSARREGGQLQ